MAIVIFENYGTVFRNYLDTLHSVFSRKSSSKIISIAVTLLGPASLRYCNGPEGLLFLLDVFIFGSPLNVSAKNGSIGKGHIQTKAMPIYVSAYR